jgi:hypothetical protein
MTTMDAEDAQLNIREKLAHIDQMLADHDRKRQEIRHAPWIIGISLMTTGAAFIKIFG